jgi:hypothetical protein
MINGVARTVERDDKILNEKSFRFEICQCNLQCVGCGRFANRVSLRGEVLVSRSNVSCTIAAACSMTL